MRTPLDPVPMILVAVLAVTPFVRAEEEPVRTAVRVPVSAGPVVAIDSVPAAQRGSDIRDPRAAFVSRKLEPQDGVVVVEAGRDPVYVVAGDAALPALPPPEQSPFGFHPANVPERGSPFAAATEIGVRWHRSALYAHWILVQPTPEDIDSGRFDWQIDREWKAVPTSMAILANIGLPERREGSGKRGGKPQAGSWRLTHPEEKYLRFVQATVERYDGDGVDDMPGLKVPIRHWQFENEPDGFDCTDWEGFAHLQEITYGAVKQACPEAVVLLGGQTGGGIPVFERFYRPILRRLGGKSLDVYDLHYYGDARLDWQGIRAEIAHIRRALDELGYARAEIWVTEMGSSSGTPDDEGPRPLRHPVTQSEREQARDLVKRHVFPLALGVRRVFWAFGLIEGFMHDDGYFDHTGLIYDGEFDDDPPRGTRKLAYFTYRKMTELLDGADWSRSERLDLGEHVTCVRVPRGAGTVAVVWYDPPFREDRLPAEVLRQVRERLAAIGAGAAGEGDARRRLGQFIDLIRFLLREGGPAWVEKWAPHAAVREAERAIRDGDPEGVRRLEELIARARATFGE